MSLKQDKRNVYSVPHWIRSRFYPLFCYGYITNCIWISAIQLQYNDIIMSAMASQIWPASPLFSQPFIQAQIKENIKAPRHWPLCGEFTVDLWIPAQRASNAENDSIRWRHHVPIICRFVSSALRYQMFTPVPVKFRVLIARHMYNQTMF